MQASFASSSVETFNSPTCINGNLVTTFSGNPLTGTYSGAYSISGANVTAAARNRQLNHHKQLLHALAQQQR